MCRFFFRRRGPCGLGGGLLSWLFLLVLVGLVGECGGVVCELDSVFVFCFYACFLFLSIFLVGIACRCGGFSGLNVYMFCSESLILAQDERWRRA